ncbi:phytanoyl-CoA dioxygenase [Kaistia algarum]|nr:phytanoyl-CoA dioxygenase [Kaistia algarum]
MRDPDPTSLSFAADGAEICAGLVADELGVLLVALRDLPRDQPGVRIQGRNALSSLLAPEGPIGSAAAAVLQRPCRTVRAVLFDKTAETNWALAWHQDRTISVRARREVDGFGPWTVKAGLLHVAPPFALLARMATLRIHLDDVPPTNAPLLIAPGSHRRGRIAVGEVDSVVRQCGVHACLARAGDVWLYSTPILHASERASEPAHRRVLQVDYSPDELPAGLEWQGV